MVDEGQDQQSRQTTTKEIFEDLKDWSGRVFQKFKEEADTLSTKGKLKLDLTTLKSRRGSEFRKLGMKVFHLIEKGKYDIPETGVNLTRLQELSEEIHDRENKLKELDYKPSAEDEGGSEETSDQKGL